MYNTRFRKRKIDTDIFKTREDQDKMFSLYGKKLAQTMRLKVKKPEVISVVTKYIYPKKTSHVTTQALKRKHQ